MKHAALNPENTYPCYHPFEISRVIVQNEPLSTFSPILDGGEIEKNIKYNIIDHRSLLPLSSRLNWIVPCEMCRLFTKIYLLWYYARTGHKA